jgi:hypothetical protein
MRNGLTFLSTLLIAVAELVAVDGSHFPTPERSIGVDRVTGILASPAEAGCFDGCGTASQKVTPSPPSGFRMKMPAAVLRPS